MFQNSVRKMAFIIFVVMFSFTILFPLAAEAAIAFVQKVSNTTSSAGSLSLKLPANVTAGNLLVVSVSGWPNLPAVTAVTDSLGNSYAAGGNVLLSQGAYSAIYYAGNVKGGVDTITFTTVSSGGQISMVVSEFSGVAMVSPLDKTSGATGTGKIPSSGVMTPAIAGSLLIGSGTHNGTSVTTVGSGFTMIAIPTEDSDTHQPLAMEYQVLSGTTQSAATFNLATAYPWTQNGALFKPAGQPATDTIAPTVTAFTIPSTATSLLVTISSFSATDNIAVTGYLLTESATAPSATASGWTTSAPTSYSFAAAGSKTLFAWARDAAGNVSASRSAVVNITLSDTTLPTVSAFTIPASASSLTVAINSFSATDNVGVTGYLITESSAKPSSTATGWSTTPPATYTFDTTGSKMLYAWAKDAAGNVSASKSATIVVIDQSSSLEPSGWYAGDMHAHRSCGGAPEATSSIFQKMDIHKLSFVSLLADMGNGEVQDPYIDLPLITGRDASISTPDKILHWDAEWHWDPIYWQYPHQALGGHVVTLGLLEGHQIWEEYTYPIFDWAHQKNGIAGFAHMQYLDGGIPQDLTCCTPVEYPVEVALGAADFISEDVVDVNHTVAGMNPEYAMQAYYRLLNCGFRPGLAAGTDYPCVPSNTEIGALLTYVQVDGGAMTYDNWVAGIAKGRTVISRNGHNEFLDLKVNGSASPGDEIKLTGSGSVQAAITWTTKQNLSGTIELLKNGVVVATKQASAGSGAPAGLTATVNFTKSGWLAARRMGSNGHVVHTAAVFVSVNNAPVRASAADATFYVQWMDNLLAKTSPGGAWNSYFTNNLSEAQERYRSAKALFQQIAAEAAETPTTPPTESTIFTTQTPVLYENDATYELGTKFRADVNGQVTQLRIYTNSQEGGSHTARIWRVSDQTLLGGPYTWNITAGSVGWKNFTLPAAVTIAANTDYIVSVSNSSDRYYAAQNHGFDTPIVNGSLRTYVGSGVYAESLGAMPTLTWENSSYFRDVVFVPQP